MKSQGIFFPEIPCACLKLLLNGSAWLEIWIISCIGLLCKMHTFFVLILYKGADQTARIHGLSIYIGKQFGPRLDPNIILPMRTIIHTMGPYRKQLKRDWWTCFKMSEKPSQKHKSVPKHLSLLLLLSKFANSLDPEDRWYAGYIHIPQERIFNPCMNLLEVSFKIEMNLSSRHYFMLFGYLSHVIKAQMSLGKCAFSIQHAAWNTSQPAHNVGPLLACQWNGGSLAGGWWPAFRCVLG